VQFISFDVFGNTRKNTWTKACQRWVPLFSLLAEIKCQVFVLVELGCHFNFVRETDVPYFCVSRAGVPLSFCSWNWGATFLFGYGIAAQRFSCVQNWGATRPKQFSVVRIAFKQKTNEKHVVSFGSEEFKWEQTSCCTMCKHSSVMRSWTHPRSRHRCIKFMS